MTDQPNIMRVIAQMRKFAIDNNIPIIKDGAMKILLQTVLEQSPKRILEIGTAIGYSTLLMASVMPQDCIIYTMEIDEARVKLALNYWQEAQQEYRIQIIVGDANLLLPTVPGLFDVIFIDGPKGQYPNILAEIRTKLAPGAVIIADNVLFRNMVLAKTEPPRRFRTIVKRLRQYLALVSDESLFTTNIYPDGDGIAVSYYKGEHASEKT